MKIQTIRFPENVTKHKGLEPVEMDRLGKVVILAGRNGSGKTRFLDLLYNQINLYPSPETEQDLLQKISLNKNQLASISKTISDYTKELQNKHDATKAAIRSDHLRRASEIQSNISNYHIQLSHKSYLTLIPEKQEGQVVKFVPKTLSLTDSDELTERQLTEAAAKIYRVGTGDLSRGTIPAIYKIQRR